MNCMLPEIVDPSLPRDFHIGDLTKIIEAQFNIKRKNNSNYKKEYRNRNLI